MADAVRLNVGAGAVAACAAAVAVLTGSEFPVSAAEWALPAAVGTSRSGAGASLVEAGGAAWTRRCTACEAGAGLWATGAGPSDGIAAGVLELGASAAGDSGERGGSGRSSTGAAGVGAASAVTRCAATSVAPSAGAGAEDEAGAGSFEEGEAASR